MQYCGSKKEKKPLVRELVSVPDKNQNMAQEERDNFEKYSQRNNYNCILELKEEGTANLGT